MNSLVFTLVVIFNSIELSTQVGSEPSSSASSSEHGISPNIKGELDWKSFTFPAQSGAQYVTRSWLVGEHPNQVMHYEYEDIPAGRYRVQANNYEAYGFLLHQGVFLRIYVGGHQAAVSLKKKQKISSLWHIFQGKPVTRLLNHEERDYLSKQWPTGYY